MFEREIKFIYDFNLNKVKKTGSFLTYEQLLAADLHPAIMQYISAEIDFLIFEDRQKMLKNSVFDYSGGKITHYFKLISQEVKKSKRFSSEYISKLILHASSFTVNFLIRPKWSLIKFIFDDEEHKTAVEIKQILNYLYYYGYLKNVLVSYLDKKKILSMNKDEFAELLDKIEKLGVETYLDDVLNTALKSMAEFFNIGTTQKNKVPLPGIQIFLKEKKLTDHINSLNENFNSDEKINYELKDLQKVLLGISTEKDDDFEELVEEDIKDSKTNINDEIEVTGEVVEDNDAGENKKVKPDIEENIETEAEAEHEKEIENEFEIESIEENVYEENTTEIENTELTDSEIEVTKEENTFDDNYETEEFVEENINDENDIENENQIEDFEETETTEETNKNEFIEEDEIESESEAIVKEEHTQSLEEILEEDIEENKNIEEREHEAETFAEENIANEDNLETEETENELIEEEPIADDEIDNTEDDSINEIEEDEPSLFKDEDLKEEESEPEENINFSEEPTESEEISGATLIDMSEILEHKNMTKIIENIFDYDMEDFANTIDMISECPSKAEALALINELFENNNIKSNSKEAETFKSIISEYFDKVE